MNTAWTITLAAGLLLAVAVAAFLTIRGRRNRAAAIEDARPKAPTPDGPGYEDGDPMPHPKSAPFEGVASNRRVPRVGDAFGGGSSTGRRLTQSQRTRADRAAPYDPYADPSHPLFIPGIHDPRYPAGSGVDTPSRDTSSDTSSDSGSHSWGGYSGGGYSSGHSSSGHDSGGSSSYGGSGGGSSYGGDSGGSSGGSSGGGGGGE